MGIFRAVELLPRVFMDMTRSKPYLTRNTQNSSRITLATMASTSFPRPFSLLDSMSMRMWSLPFMETLVPSQICQMNT